MELIYSIGRFQDEDEYKIMKVQQFIKNHIVKHVKCCKEEGTKSTNNFETKSAKVLKFGKSNENLDLTKKRRQKIQYYETNRIYRTLTDR